MTSLLVFSFRQRRDLEHTRAGIPLQNNEHRLIGVKTLWVDVWHATKTLHTKRAYRRHASQRYGSSLIHALGSR